MLISVLLSLYYKENPLYLKECLESLLKQTLQANEIVIVFDGEITPELESVVENFKNKLPIKIIRLPKNVGLGKALNEGLKHCSNDWVFRMDTDDICVPERFEKQVSFILQNPNVVLVGGQIVEFEKNILETKSVRKVPLTKEEIIVFSKKRCPFSHMTVAYKKEVILKLGGYQHHMFMEDYNLWLRVIAKGYDIANMKDTLVYMRAGNDMISRRRGFVYLKSEWQLFQLKKELNIQNSFSAFCIFALRATTRLLPVFILKKIYSNLLRNN